MSVIAELRQFREGKKVPLRKLQQLSGISYSRICKIENGKAPLTYEDLIRISKALQVPQKTVTKWVRAITEGINLVG